MDRDEITEIVKQAVDAAFTAHASKFPMDPEKHYKSHESFDRFMKLYEDTSSTIFRWFLGVVVVGILAIAGVGFFGGKA